MYRKLLALCLLAALAAACLVGCAPAAKAPAATEAPLEKVTLTVAGGWTDCRAIDEVAKAFMAENPGCAVVYEYIQDYYPSLEKRMSGDAPVDLFFTTNIQAGSPMLPYALDLSARKELSLENAFPGLLDNFVFREESGQNTKLYAVPVGAEMRGLYVNKTLLQSVGLSVPTNRESLLSACEILKQNGYIAFHGNPGNFAQLLVYPWIGNLIANAADPAAAHDRVAAHEPGLSEMFREPYRFVYTLVENDYMDYKRVQTEMDMFNETSDEAVARYFLNIRSDGNGAYEKADDLGVIPFMPGAMSAKSVVDKTKEDYHSQIDYAFIPAPVGEEGGYVYLSPAHGIAVNKDGKNVEWALKFLDFLFQPANSEVFAKAFNVIPNTKEAFSYIRALYDIPDSRICHLGQVTFDYGFYDMLQPTLASIAKANNPKYMRDDGSGNLTLYPFEYYMEELEASVREQ